MSFAPLDVTGPGGTPSPQIAANQQSEAAVRRMASEFEALLLRQLTSSINSNSDDEEGESLFGNGGGGLGLSKQLFSEQMADTMAKNGGVGLADMIVKQVLDNRAEKSPARAKPPTARALDAARSIRDKAPAKAENNRADSRAEEIASTSSRSQEIAPARTTRSRFDRNSLAPLPNSSDIVIISRASDANEAARKSFLASKVSKVDTSDAPSEVTADDSADSPRANSSANPNSGQRFMTEDDVMSLVRPRRVSAPTNVEDSSPASNPVESSPISQVEQSSPESTEPFVPASFTRATEAVRRPVSRPFPRQINFSSISRTNHAPAITHAVNAPAARAKAVTPMTSVNSSAPVGLNMYVRGPIRSRFGPRIDPINGRLRMHTGIDIAAPAGTPIGAAAAGKVVFSGRNGGYGNMVIIEHPDGTLTRYGHAEKLLVNVGDEVSSGEVIALVGSTGHSTGPHLHFEVKKNGEFVNPLTVLPKDFTLVGR